MPDRYVYALTRRSTGFPSEPSLIGHYSRPSLARAAAYTHEKSLNRYDHPEYAPRWKHVTRDGLWWCLSRLNMYLYEVRREVANPEGV